MDPPGDVRVILAHASRYYDDALALRSKEMDPQEMAHVLTTFMYMAHAYVEDNTCPLNIWHQRLCARYCTLPLLNTAMVKLMRMRRFILRVPEEDLALRCDCLEGCRAGPRPAAHALPAPAPPQAPPSALAASTLPSASLGPSFRHFAPAAGGAFAPPAARQGLATPAA